MLALYASGKTTGISCDIGEGCTAIAPIVEGYPITEAVKKNFYGGKQITDSFARMLNEDNDIFANLD